MQDLLKTISCDPDEIEWLLKDIRVEDEKNAENIIKLLLKYNCDKEFIKNIIFNHKRLFEMDLERITYIIEAILSNGDIIEEMLLELV